MATDSQLEYSSITDVVVPFQTSNGIGDISTGLTQLTGYTLSETPFIFTPLISALDGTNIGASLDKLIWDFGDGTQATGFSVSKHYQYPGEYRITTIFTDQNGNTHRNSVFQDITVYNYIPDALTWYTDRITNPCGGLPEFALCGKPSNDLTIYRYNSWQSWPCVSGDGNYYINLYSQGSMSRPLTPEQYETSSDIHYVPTWRFVEGKDSTKPVQRVQTKYNDFIYVKNVNGTLVQTSSSDQGSIFAGTTGYTTVNYIDDNPNRLTSTTAAGSNDSASATFRDVTKTGNELSVGQGTENKDIILFASFDTSKFPVTVADSNLSTFEILKNDYFQMYETQKIGLPIQVKFNTPKQLIISSNGLTNFNIHKNKYLDSPFAFSARTSDLSGNTICTDVITPLSSKWSAQTESFSGGDITTDVLTGQGFVTLYLSGEDSDFTNYIQEFETNVSRLDDYDTQQTYDPDENGSQVELGDSDISPWDIGSVLATPRSSFIMVMLADRKTGELTGRNTTILTTQLIDSQLDYLYQTKFLQLTYGPLGIPLAWKTKHGLEYYGYISPKSCYGDVEYVDIEEYDSTNTPTGQTYTINVPLSGFVRRGNRFNSSYGKDSLSEYREFGVNENALPATWCIIDEQENRINVYGKLANQRLMTSVDTTVKDDYITTNTYGTYAGYINAEANWSSLSASNKHRIYAHTTIDLPTYFENEVLYYYLASPDNDLFHQVKPLYYREYSYGMDGNTQSYTPPVSTLSPGNSGIYGFAVDPVGNVIMVDGDRDRILRYCRSREFREQIDIHTLLPETSGSHYPGKNDEYGYSPSSVSLDKNLDYWVTLYDTVSTVKIDGTTNQVIAVAVPPVENYIAEWRTSDPVDGPQGLYGENIIKPSVVETCKNNDIVVSYTNPLCSFVARYDTDGIFLHKYDFPGEDRYFAGEMCIDASDHLWAITESTGLNYDGSVDMNPGKSVIFSLDEQLRYRGSVHTLSGTRFIDSSKPIGNTDQTFDLEYSLAERETQTANGKEYTPIGWVETSMDPEQTNITLTMFEGNTYNIKNLNYNLRGHKMSVRELLTDDLITVKGLDQPDPGDYVASNIVWTTGVSGADTQTLIIKPTEHLPEYLYIVSDLDPTLKFFIRTMKKPTPDLRDVDTFDIINNATFLTPDNNNNIWFSWGDRFASRYNIKEERVDTTVAVGSGHEDTRYHPLSAETHERRDNANRRSSIEGLGMDTGNNLLIAHDFDKRIYSMNSDTPTVSAYIGITTEQKPYETYTWVDSLSSDDLADQENFIQQGETDAKGQMLSYLTDEQIKVFLANTNYTGTNQQKMEAYNNYVATQTPGASSVSPEVQGTIGDIQFRTSHGAPGVSAVGFETELRAGGDWTGFRWINKYDDRVVESDETTGFVFISGMSDEFELIPEHGKYDIAKINEDLDFAEVIRQYVLQPGLRDKQTFYNNFLDGVFGTSGDSPITLGKVLYERITNYMSNHNDIDTCTIDALQSLAEMIDYKLDKLGPMPAGVKRVFDLMSIKLSKLKGTRTNDQLDFEKYGNWSSDTIGVNLGPEINFINDYDPELGYGSNDYVKYQNEFYESVRSVPRGIEPIKKSTTEYWRHWPDGYIRARHMDDINRVYRNNEKYTDEWRVKKYNDQKILMKLTQNYMVRSDQPIVLREWFSDKYTRVIPMIINYAESRVYDFTFDYNKKDYKVTDPSNRNKTEYISLNDFTNPIFNLNNDGVMTMMGSDVNTNPTMYLLRDRTYTFNVSSPGYPMYITTTPGPSAEILRGHVTNQGTEIGEMTFKTDTDPLYDDLPETLYYQCLDHPGVGGMIRLYNVVNMPHYSTEFGGVTAYNINISFSGHNDVDRLGWGLSFPEDGNVWQHYSIHEYIPNANTEQTYISNIIDWDSENTSVLFNDIVYEDWSKDGGVIDVAFEKCLRRGLGMFNGMESLSVYATGADVNTVNKMSTDPEPVNIIGGWTL